MSFDGFVTHNIVKELSDTILNGKIDKVHQPESDEIIISVRTFGGTHKILLSASASNPRVHLTSIKKENPMTPPMLCMLMRKHLSGGVISAVSQMGFDRIIKIDVKTHNELGDECICSVIIEIMGRHSNIILIDENQRVMDCAKHIDFTVSAVRQMLPGITYTAPPGQNKKTPEEITLTGLMDSLSSKPDDTLLDKFLVSEIMGMSILLAREIVYDFSGKTNVIKNDVDLAAFVVYTVDFIKKLADNQFSPSLVIDNIEKKPSAFSCVNLSQYEGSGKVEEIPSISQVVDSFYELRSLKERLNRHSYALLKLVGNNIERCEKKLVIHRESLKEAEGRDKFKMFGDLITANIYRIKYGDKSVKVENYYSENCEEIEIPLDETISPSQNAQKYYKKYNKAKTTESYALEQIEIAENEKFYLESVYDSIEKIESLPELEEIRQELVDEGYIKERTDKKKKQQQKNAPFKYISHDGYEILVGRNNKQNDELTLKMAYSTDIWLHTKQIPGSHTIIRTKGEGEVPDKTLLQAACLAAYYSKARNSSQVPVDYTIVKNVKKPRGAKPGMVIYDNYNTLYVLPDESAKKEVEV